MFKSIPPIETITPESGEHITDGGTTKCEEKNIFLEIERNYENPYGSNPYSIQLQKINGIDQLCEEIKRYAENFTKLSASTIKRDISYLRNMADPDQPVPIDLFKPSYTQYIYHMTWYKNNYYSEKTGENFYGLKQKKEAYSLYLKACGIPQHYFSYDLPMPPGDKPIEFPNPDIAFEITRGKYYKDKHINWLIQFMHLFNFIVGCRPPSETTSVKIGDIDFDECSIKHRQQKKHQAIRKIFVEEVFINGRTRKSLRNYIDYHRDNFVTQYSGDYLFISPWSGQPFKPAYLGKILNDTGSTVYPSWYPYMARHFCATGRLIEAYLDKDPDPIKRVQDYMHHDKRINTEKYTRLARDYYKKYSYNWFYRILKNRNDPCLGIYNKTSLDDEYWPGGKSNEWHFLGRSMSFSPRDQYSPVQIITVFLLLEKSKEYGFKLVSISLIKTFLFSFNKANVDQKHFFSMIFIKVLDIEIDIDGGV